MQITKAEILWSRRCLLSCPYCAMADGRRNSLPVNEWKLGMHELRKMDCLFAAFYGAEPLLEFEKLPTVVGYAENIGINTTVITSGCVPDFYEKLEELHRHGAKSISMSHDILPLNLDSEIKSRKALDGLRYFSELGSIRDVAAIATLTRLNYPALPDFIREMTKLGIWVFFDFIHPYRGQSGAKTRSTPELSDLLFREEDYDILKQVLDEVLALKKEGYLCHSSEPFINMISYDNFYLLRTMRWNCAREVNFPAWLTIDCDGSVHACDDFQVESPFHITSISKKFKEFEEAHRTIIVDNCPGCCWNTHIDAHLVKSGFLANTDYVHGL